MFDNIIMINKCLTVFASSEETLNHDQSVNFLCPFSANRFVKDILICLQKNQSVLNGNFHYKLLSKDQQKGAIQTFWVSKKIKYLNDPTAVKKAKKL